MALRQYKLLEILPVKNGGKGAGNEPALQRGYVVCYTTFELSIDIFGGVTTENSDFKNDHQLINQHMYFNIYRRLHIALIYSVCNTKVKTL
jgi:hypothetical protein